uniref:Protein capI n=1 Tax=Arundo donax TaxID=35708 RepID=A0A0A9GGZ4_ARUDO
MTPTRSCRSPRAAAGARPRSRTAPASPPSPPRPPRRSPTAALLSSSRRSDLDGELAGQVARDS